MKEYEGGNHCDRCRFRTYSYNNSICNKCDGISGCKPNYLTILECETALVKIEKMLKTNKDSEVLARYIKLAQKRFKAMPNDTGKEFINRLTQLQK